MTTDGPIERAKELYEQAVFGGDADALGHADRELDAVEADLALARGRIVHARFLETRDQEDPRELPLFERAAELYHRLGNVHGEAEALFWIGCYHQVLREDHPTARPFLERSATLAADDELTRSYAVRHLGFADLDAGDTASARRHLEESVRLRRDLGWDAGVAAGLIALAYLEGGDQALLDEAEELARNSESHGVMRWIEQARRA